MSRDVVFEEEKKWDWCSVDDNKQTVAKFTAVEQEGDVVVRRKRNKCTYNTKVTQDIQYDTQNLMISTVERMTLYSLLLNLKIN